MRDGIHLSLITLNKSKFIKKYVDSTFITDDAPSDSNAYLRHNNNWKFIETPISSISDAPSDDGVYDRKDNNWVIQDPRTNLMTKQVIGVELVAPGGGSGTWRNIDANGNPVTFLNNTQRKAYFDNHPIWGNIKEEIIDGQYMIRIPKFYFKNDNHRKIWISPYKVNDTFKCHPAFMKNGEEMDCFWIGKYIGTVVDSKLSSQPNTVVYFNMDLPKSRTYARNRNVDGSDGWFVWDIYNLASIQFLFLIEYSTSNAQTVLGSSHTGYNANLKSDDIQFKNCSYRGIYGLYGRGYAYVDGFYGSSPIKIFDPFGNKTYINTGLSMNSIHASKGYYILTMDTRSGNNFDLKDIFLTYTHSSSYSTGTYSGQSWVGSGSSLIYFFGSTSSTLRTGEGMFAIEVSVVESYGNGVSRLIKI